MTTGQRMTGFSLYVLQAVGAIGVLISLAGHRIAGIVIFGLLIGLSSMLINRIVRLNPGVLKRSRIMTRIHMLFLWCVIGCIAFLLIGVPLLRIMSQRH